MSQKKLALAIHFFVHTLEKVQVPYTIKIIIIFMSDWNVTLLL